MREKKKVNTLVYPVSCPLCGNENLKKISKRGQYGLPCHVSICPKDGLVFLSPRWSNEEYKSFYVNEYDRLYQRSALRCETVNKYKRIEEICGRLESYHITEDRESVLDVGSGMGWTLEYLKLHYSSFKYFAAIEPSEHCVKNLKEKINAEIVARDIDSSWRKAHSKKFDLIIMRHVLEHLLNPIEAMKQISKSLLDNGVVYIAVPNMMNPKGLLYRYWFRAVHTFYFSESTLIEVACRADLRPICIQEEGSELWGIFQKSKADVVNESEMLTTNNVYHEQLSIIRNYKFKKAVSEVKYTLRKSMVKALSFILPAKIISWLKASYHNSDKNK